MSTNLITKITDMYLLGDDMLISVMKSVMKAVANNEPVNSKKLEADHDRYEDLYAEIIKELANE